MADNQATIDLEKLPAELQARALAWRNSQWPAGSVQVAARLDDANEFRIMRLEHGETPWVGWCLVRFGTPLKLA